MEEFFIVFIPRFLLVILALQLSFLPSSYYKLKIEKSTSGVREALVVLCVEGGRSPPHIGAHGQFGGRIFPDPPLHRHPSLNSEPLHRGGPKACWQGRGRAPGAFAPGLGPFGFSFAWLASGWARIVVVLWIGPDLVSSWASWAICVDLQLCASNDAFSL
jgi:hypothetical protein